MRSLQKETARLLGQPSRECKTPKAQFSKGSQMNHSTAPCCLQFESTPLEVIDRDGQPWLLGTQIAHALGYARSDKVSEIYRRNASEFNPGMTLTLKLRVKGFGNGYSEKETRIFSLRGAHLLAMFARTPKAQAFRRWVLDILDRETAVPPAPTFEAQTALTPDEYRELLEKRGKIIVDRKDYEHWQVSTEFGADPYRPYRDAAEWVVKLGAKHGRGAAVAMLAQFDANHLYRVPVHRVPELVAACKRALGEEQPAPAAPALTQQQAEEITQRLDSLARLFHPHSQPFADVMGISRALHGLDPKLGARAPAFVPLLTKDAPVPETPLRQQVVQTLRAEYSHGDYKALARDLGIHESSAKKIVGRLKLGASA